ncbi:sulfite exporter TauE/SafE family protein [Kitasatospora sp. MAP5-34]|uniref:HoxN/HupN/NixA family nickel/cobalt transporter n=1 Tax=Kitasatospora sp. MAP5-34 TaxID=3035102 RepID=UPI0024730F67|nr:sulfite exporter TauE/SafE family protein [Kitasatospora sp. MAP5-34]MDH6574561.1 nickel/cobalt exporter [Kitasatospora sp. MAP5-34]
MAVLKSLARTGVAVGGALWLLTALAPEAGAHPLGNFSVNHYVGFTLHTDRIEALAVTDTAEIPTLQEQAQIDRDGNGTVDDAERAAWAATQCAQAAQRLSVTAESGGRAVAVPWTVRSQLFEYRDGAAGLRTSRLECGLEAPLRIAGSGTRFQVSTGVDPTRVGWNEITARGDGVRLDHSDVPETSVSGQLTNYPRDLLDNPRGVTRASFAATPGSGPSSGAASASGSGFGISASGPSRWIAALNSKVVALGGARRLTVPVGLLAVLLSIVLGAGHALLPGHGKAVMAAYLAGRRGRTRDAITVGATVTVTHTAGVLVLGLCLTAFSSLAGDRVLGWLGVVSGALVALVGGGLLLGAVRRLRAGGERAGGEALLPVAERELVAAGAGAVTHGHHEHHEHGVGHEHEERHEEAHGHTHRHGLFGRAHHHHHHEPDQPARPLGKGGLIGLGIAGGLVPSPSALVVLLGAVALGRTLFGATLVVAYGLGMAGTLTAVGLLIVRLGDRFAGAADRPVVRRLRRIAPYTAASTALLVLVVGTGLLIRSLPAAL